MINQVLVVVSGDAASVSMKFNAGVDQVLQGDDDVTEIAGGRGAFREYMAVRQFGVTGPDSCEHHLMSSGCLHKEADSVEVVYCFVG